MIQFQLNTARLVFSWIKDGTTLSPVGDVCQFSYQKGANHVCRQPLFPKHGINLLFCLCRNFGFGSIYLLEAAPFHTSSPFVLVLVETNGSKEDQAAPGNIVIPCAVVDAVNTYPHHEDSFSLVLRSSSLNRWFLLHCRIPLWMNILTWI